MKKNLIICFIIILIASLFVGGCSEYFSKTRKTDTAVKSSAVKGIKDVKDNNNQVLIEKLKKSFLGIAFWVYVCVCSSFILLWLILYNCSCYIVKYSKESSPQKIFGITLITIILILITAYSWVSLFLTWI